MTVLQNCKNFIARNQLALLFAGLFPLIALIMVIVNGSFLFEYDFINKVGDQRLYYNVAYNMAQGEFPKSLYTIGYPLLYLPFVVLTGVQPAWQSIMSYVIATQAFVLMPVAIFLIFKNKTRVWSLIALGIMTAYLGCLLALSGDVLIKYNFFGLIPLSEPLAVFCLIVAYYVYLRWVRGKSSYRSMIVFALLFALALLTRNTSVILFCPIFVDMLLDKHYRQFLVISGMSVVFYTPQLLYNYLSSKDILFSGYMWWAERHLAKDMANIERLYGIKSSAMFSLSYLLKNIPRLAIQYLPFLAIGAVVRKYQADRFTLLVLLFTLVNILFYLAYWWSAAGGLLDRFLLPNFFLLMFIFGNTMLTGKGAHENKR